ncbi:MAG: hypothetical protein IK066_06170, partial [Kiritimatiellae bacterium]|nr:hypothetical protein [Kiritimatiellia bacterium]
GGGRAGAGWTGKSAPGGMAALRDAGWGLMRGGGGGEAAGAGKGRLAERWRLAGVFMVSMPDEGEEVGLGERAGNEARYAILDDLGGGGGQVVAAEGEWVDDAETIRLVKVENDYAKLSDGKNEVLVPLARASGGGTGGRTAGGAASGLASAVRTVLETNRFGARTGEARWEFSRAEVMKYAQEVLDDPQRVAGMYEGLAPDWDEEHKVAGYRLDTSKGEAEFYAQVGLRDGDVVRKVNSIKMTSQRRSEFLLGEFLQGRLGTVVIDIERDGKPEKLVYLFD